MMLSPVVTSWNAAGAVCARLYSVGLILPKPGADCTPLETSHWFMRAATPANSGAPTEVPPNTASHCDPDPRLPPLHADGSLVNTTYPSWSAEAEIEMSGTSRALSLGTPAPVCQA